jgi:hypothetical protein
MKSVYVNILSSILATATFGPIVNASIMIHSASYSLSSTCPVGGPSSSGQLVGDTLFDEIAVTSLCRASVSVQVDPNVPQQYFSSTLKAVGNFNHGVGWDRAGVNAQLTMEFTVDTAVICSWSGSSDWLPSGGLGDLTGSQGFIALSGAGSTVLNPGTYRFWGVATVGWLTDQPINGYGSFWFAVPSPATFSLILGAGLLMRRIRS